MSRFLVLAGLLALGAGPLHAQTRSTPSQNVVQVDFRATLDGKSIDDLRPEDVQVLEDGVSQTIESFKHIPDEPGSPRVFILFLDTLHSPVEASSNLRLPLIRFLDRLVGPDDLIAATTPELSGAGLMFGQKAAVISNIMQAEWTWGRPGRLDVRDLKDPKEQLYDACFGSARSGQTTVSAEMAARRREQRTLDALSDLVDHASEAGEGRKALLIVSDGWQLFRAHPELASADTRRESPRDVFRRQPRPTPPEDSSAAVVNRAECEADRVALSQLDDTQRLRELSEAANRANVTFYPIYASGLGVADTGADASSPTRPSSVNPRVGQDSLRFLADNTDGTAILNRGEVEAGLQQVTNDLSSYYLVEYSSTNTKLDGRFRAISVRVSRSGVRVRNRRGYRGRTASELLSNSTNTPDTKSSSGLATALTPLAGVSTRAQFRIRTSTWSLSPDTSQSGGGFWVVGEIDYRTRRELAWTSGATAEVTVLAADGTEVDSRSLTVRTEDGPFGFRVPQSGELPTGEYAVRVQLTSDADSSLMLADTARVVLSPGTGLGEAVLWRRGPTTGLQHRRTADPRFQRSDRLRLELPSSIHGAAKARLLDRNGGLLSVPVQVADRDDATDGLHWIVVDASLAPLAPGDYAIEVTQGAVKRVTPFRIVP